MAEQDDLAWNYGVGQPLPENLIEKEQRRKREILARNIAKSQGKNWSELSELEKAMIVVDTMKAQNADAP